jgi:hypothetical protein
MKSRRKRRHSVYPSIKTYNTSIMRSATKAANSLYIWQVSLHSQPRLRHCFWYNFVCINIMTVNPVKYMLVPQLQPFPELFAVSETWYSRFKNKNMHSKSMISMRTRAHAVHTSIQTYNTSIMRRRRQRQQAACTFEQFPCIANRSSGTASNTILYASHLLV